MIVELPNGQVVNVADDASPDVIARLKATNQPKAGQRAYAPPAAVVKPSQAQTDADKVQQLRHSGPLGRIASLLDNNPITGALDAIGGGVARGITGNWLDEAGAAIMHPIDAVRHAVTGENNSYTRNRDMAREMDDRQIAAHPIASAVGELGGALAMPVGTGAGALKLAGKASPRIAEIAAKLEQAPGYVKAALAGGNQGAINAAGSAKEDTLGAASSGYGTGLAAGGALGALAGTVGKAVNIYKDTRPDAAKRTAFLRIAQLLDKGGKSADDVASDIQAGKAAGSDPALMDATPGLRAQVGSLSRDPNLPASNDLMAFTENRLQNRPALYSSKVAEMGKNVGVTQDADALKAGIEAERKAKGAADYETAYSRPMTHSSVMDDILKGPAKELPMMQPEKRQAAYEEINKLRAIQATGPDYIGQDVKSRNSLIDQRITQLGQEMDAKHTVRVPNPAVQDAFKEAKAVGRMQDADPMTHRWVWEGDDAPVQISSPTMQTWDYIKRGFDRRIGKALDSKDRDTARFLSDQLGKVKGEVIKYNPDYGTALANQRDLFQRTEAVDLGQTVLQRLRKPNNEARRVYEELSALKDPQKQLDARSGIIDAMLGTHNTAADPVRNFYSYVRSPDQRKVVAWAFGGEDKLQHFEQFLHRETQATRADVLGASGRQSETARLFMADGDGTKNLKDIAMDAARGYGFGGITGMFGNVARGASTMATHMGKDARNEIAKLLMSDGKEIPAGVKDANKFLSDRKRRLAQAAMMAGKAGQQLPTDLTGN